MLGPEQNMLGARCADRERRFDHPPRETAPAAATADMYLDENGEPIRSASFDGPLSAGIPGQAAGQVVAAAEDLSNQAGSLDQKVDGFLADIRAA